MNTFTRLAASLAVCGVGSVGLAQEADDIFKSLDKNSDGILVADEVPEAQQRFFERLIRAGDENEDGKLSKAEYQATLKEDERPAGRPAAGGPAGGRGQFDPGAIFDRLDTNKDGKLAKSELPDGVGERMGRIFDEAGKDELTKEEYGQAMAKMMRAGGRPGAGPAGEPGRPGGPGFFEQLDKNKDGKISKDEIPEQMKERMAGMFERLGVDSISLEQLSQMRSRGAGDQPPGEGRGREMRRDESRPESDAARPERDGERPPMRNDAQARDGRPGEGRPDAGPGRPGMGRPGMGGPGMGGPGGPGGFAFMRVLDENKDGRISQGEALRVAKLFDELDANKDGELDARELMGFEGPPREGDRPGMGRLGEGRPEGDRPPGARRPEGDRPEGTNSPGRRPEGDRGGYGPEAFVARFDENKDGLISKEEAPERMAENFDRLDQNKDGKLSAEEFGNMLRGGRPGGEGRPGGNDAGRRPGTDGEGSSRPKRPAAE